MSQASDHQNLVKSLEILTKEHNIQTRMRSERISRLQADLETLRSERLAAIKPKIQELKKLGVIVTGTEMG